MIVQIFRSGSKWVSRLQICLYWKYDIMPNWLLNLELSDHNQFKEIKFILYPSQTKIFYLLDPTIEWKTYLMKRLEALVSYSFLKAFALLFHCLYLLLPNLSSVKWFWFILFVLELSPSKLLAWSSKDRNEIKINDLQTKEEYSSFDGAQLNPKEGSFLVFEIEPLKTHLLYIKT